MSKAIKTSLFTLLFSVYAFVSLAVYFNTAFTGAAWLLYSFTLVPFYLISTLYLATLPFKEASKKLIYKPLWMYLSVGLQGVIVLTAPASCHGWHQGAMCYSWIQAQLSEQGLAALTTHWVLVEQLSPIAILSHSLCVILLLRSIQLKTL
jgi:hypothetical protein